MKKILLVICCLVCFHNNISAQNILSLETAPIGGVTVILPAYGNLFKLLLASKTDFVASVTNLNYVKSKPDDPNTFKAANTDEVYNVDKDDKQLDIFFSDKGDYAKNAKTDFLRRYPNARRRLMDNGIEAYYFDANEGGGDLHYCMLFDLPPDGGGGVTLIQL